MHYIFSSCMDYLLILPLLILLEVLLCIAYKKQGIRVSLGFIVGWQLLACLITIIFSITGAGGINDIGRLIVSLNEVNFIPLKDWSSENCFGMGMNLLLFTPLGILLPLLWQKGASFVKTIGAGFLLSFCIEASQLLNFRTTDVDDLLMNTLGTALGFALYYLFLRKIRCLQIENTAPGSLLKNGALISVMLLFAVLFFLAKPIVSYLWSLIYGY